jgi:lipopolysaccharide export system protein LptA
MQKKTLLQIFLFLLIVIITITFFKFYYNPVSLISETNLKIENNDDKNKNNLMENINYVAADKIGNEYNIRSDFAEFNSDQPELILMQKVKGVIELNNSSPITIFSENAIYNKVNHDTNFFNNVVVEYEDHQILSNNLDLFFESNLASISKNIIYKSLNTELRADKIEIDLITKNSKIFMNENTKKVKVITLN